MIVKIDIVLFSNKKAFPTLERILHFFMDRRYDLFINDDEVFDSLWQQEAREAYKDIIKESFNRTVQGIKKPDIIINEHNNIEKNILSVEDGFIFLNNPAQIFLENRVNDSSFILALFSCFKSKARKAQRFYDKGWLEFVHCGGKSDVLNQLMVELEFYESFPLENSTYKKSLILVDSDKKKPDDVVALNEKIESFCVQNKMKFHFLEKREMENYLPLTLLENQEGIDSKKLEALKSLTPIQQDFYDLEKGFNLDSKSKLPPLYACISPEQYTELNKGFHPEFNVKKSIPTLFKSKFLTKELLLDKCKHQNDSNELHVILNKVNEIL